MKVKYRTPIYERKLPTSIRESRFWDSNKNEMNISQFINNPISCDYFVAANLEEAHAIENICAQKEVYSPWKDLKTNCKPGCYYYDHKRDIWHDFNKEYQEMTDLKNMFGEKE